ncbi:RIP metalloprotease RseP [Janthinobacterium sp. GW458P]|uniref:RIP metalloprotease RseP n=1 Tax=Janthinobacterium sp. GW458P TaxID=1981504 RepID=UPI000A31EB9A|nr:RIP metalloprotease RseP [Janthinobacterium sp. GW458P]MBE3024278.1 RIP metalloprotease RseP [Janthinobacterium sp. GW458P]PHV13850.1 RIP metalloprotease RseP [Janthinobacterium sp. BJB303]
MTLITTLLAFIVALGSLITLHELGHYLVARWCGVKVLRFSIGMGKVVYSRKFGKDQTEWAISALPLGGYVSMLDSRAQDLSDLPESELRREFTRQSVWRRIAIVAAGPLANFLVAIVLYAGLFMYGIEEPSSKLGPVAEQTAAYMAGLRSGDTVDAVNGKPVASWSELRWQLIQAALDKQPARIDVRRPDRGAQQASLPTDSLTETDLEGDVLGKLGLTLARSAPTMMEIVPGGAAARAGLQKNDQILAIDGKSMHDVGAIIDTLSRAPGQTLQLQLLRNGQGLTLSITPDAVQASSAGGAVTVGKIQAKLGQVPDMIVVASGPFSAVGKAAVKVWDTSAMSLKMLGKMITGQVSLKNVTGPITIADYAGQTARIGLVSYLSFIAFISISLGVMNLLPIPVLDGGHLLYYSLEVLTGRPVPERVGEVAQRLGIGLLLTLMVLAVFNDVLRLIN